jgi:hypothetical protein
MRRSPAPDLAILRPSQEAVLRAEEMPGIALAVALGAEPAQTLCMGCDAGGHELAPESLFPVASVTKLATALAVLRLVEAGRLALDDSLARHLPEAAAARPGVTLRALLSHTAGLPLDLPDGAAPYRRAGPSRTIAAIQSSSSTTSIRSLITSHRRGRCPPDAGLRAAGACAGGLHGGAVDGLHPRIVPPSAGGRGAFWDGCRRPRRGGPRLDHLPRARRCAAPAATS